MEELDTIFSIPTYRLRDVPETIERYDENFWRNGHEVALFVFDDSSLGNHDKYYSQLGKTRTANPLYYVGPREKERFIQILLQRLREPKLEALVRNLFRPSYGGNRNFTLMYSLGAFLVSSDDYVEMFLRDEKQIDPYALNDVYVLVNFRPVVTNNNWRMDCGVAAYDNRHGLPQFFPTRLRFEDYIYRLWLQQPKIASVHVDAAQRHMKNNYMRNPLAMEVFNEELCSLLKRRIKDSVFRRDDLSIAFHYTGEVTLEESESILKKITAVQKRVLAAADRAHDPERRRALRAFGANLAKSFYSFEPDFFQQNVSRIVDDVISQIRASLELWPTLVEICYFRKDKEPLPATRVRNQGRNGRK
jgi:hypothetical protein